MAAAGPRVDSEGTTRPTPIAPAHLAALWLFAFALRATFVAQAWSHPVVRIPVIDAQAYRDRALEILDGDILGTAVYYLDPLYPFFLAAIHLVVPPDSIGVLLTQAALDAGSVVLIASIAARMRADGKRFAFTNGCFDILHPGHTDYLARARSYADALIGRVLDNPAT